MGIYCSVAKHLLGMQGPGLDSPVLPQRRAMQRKIERNESYQLRDRLRIPRDEDKELPHQVSVLQAGKCSGSPDEKTALT